MSQTDSNPPEKQQPGAGLTPWQPGQSGNPNGRPKKIYTVLKKTGYSKTDIIACFEELSFYTADQLKRTFEKKSTPIIVKVIAKTLANAAKDGKLASLGELLGYLLGKPTQPFDHNAGGPIIVEDNIDYSQLDDETLKKVMAARKTRNITTD